MEFVKMHGLGNDFIIAVSGQPDLREEDYSRWAIKLCDRNFGIGADGLVIVGPDPEMDLFMRIFNSDGSEPEMCGNAIRCVARHAWEMGLVKERRIAVRTLGGPRYPEVIVEDGRVTRVRVDMGQPILEPALIPVAAEKAPVTGEHLTASFGDVVFTAVSMGNPHCVILVDEIDEARVREWGPELERHPAFPQKTNVEFVQVVNRQEVIMRVWERGAGPTLACGTGACASVVACALNGVTDRQAVVHLPGGDLLIEWDEASGHVFMTGPAARVFAGNVDLNRFEG